MEVKPIGGDAWKRSPGRGKHGGSSQEFLELRGIAESLLFVSDEPLSVRKIAEIAGADPHIVEEALEDLAAELREEDRGIQLRRLGEGWRMHTHPAHSEYVSRLLQGDRRGRLTRAALETLAIIAYMQPVTRAQIAAIRGVQTESVVKALEGYGLVREAGKESSPGGPALYVTTERFLEEFGLTSLDDLPPLESFEPDKETEAKIRKSLGFGKLSETKEEAGSISVKESNGPSSAVKAEAGHSEDLRETRENVPEAENP